MVFADENKNGNLDCDTMEFFLEPARFYKPPIEHTNWYDQKFGVEKDVTGIEIKF